MKTKKNRNIYYLFCASLSLFYWSSCQLDGNNITNALQKDNYTIAAIDSVRAQISIWAKADSLDLKKYSSFLDSSSTLVLSKNIKDLYTKNGENAIWVDKNGISKNAKMLLQALQTLPKHGINIATYQFDNLQQTANSISAGGVQPLVLQNFEMDMSYAFMRSIHDMAFGNIAKMEPEYYNRNDSAFKPSIYAAQMINNADSMQKIYEYMQPTMPLYTALQRELAKLQTLQNNAAFALVGSKKNVDSNQFVILRKRLFAEIGIPQDTITNSYDSSLASAVRHFQYLHEIKPTGLVDTLTKRKLNMPIKDKILLVSNNLERLRKLNKTFPQPYVWVNVPHMQLQYINQDSVQYRMRTVVGRKGRLTPTLDAPMTNLVINPNWSVPPTIMKEEIVPGIARKGANYLTRRGLTAYLGNRKVDASKINEKNFKRYRIEQKPGLNSSLGTVKFNLPNRHAIYLHDTPHREDFKKHYRAYSSGCIRVEKPRDFAVFLLADSNYTRQKIDSIIKTKNSKVVPLSKAIDVHIVYVTNDIDSAGNVLYLRDIYNRDNIN